MCGIVTNLEWWYFTKFDKNEEKKRLWYPSPASFSKSQLFDLAGKRDPGKLKYEIEFDKFKALAQILVTLFKQHELVQE